jgi:DNA-binding NarL/FixJ family response regulator
MHLLIADDHPVVRNRISGIIRETYPEAELIVLSGGNEVLEHLAANKCDLLIMDIKMPGRSGIDVLRTLRITNTLPVIMISSHCSKEYSIALEKAGANAFITKQHINDSLIPAIEKLIQI